MHLMCLCRFSSSEHSKVYMASRDEQRAKEALERVEKEGREPGLGEAIWHKLDLKDTKEAKASAESFLALEDRLDLLSECSASLKSSLINV
jgi:NAD(P)-dependent dehydrogenase (short-subunit alcohol dehydrogenase family)